MEWISLFVFCIQAVPDIRRRTLPAPPCLCYLLAAILWRTVLCLRGKSDLLSFAAAVLGGGILFLTAYLSAQQIGYGDCLLLTAFAFGCGVRAAAGLLFAASLLASAAAAGLLAFHKADRKSRMPFVPFLAAAQLLRLLLGEG